MKKDIILAGVGGQGILSIATVIGYAAIESGLTLKQSEVHGMSQRGGDVYSNLRISDKEIYSDLIPYGQADIIISVEPMESLRYLPYLNKNGWVIANSTPFINVPNYPELESVVEEINKLENSIIVDGEKTAKEVGNPRGMNMVMLGAASKYLDIPFEKLEEGIRFIFGRKGEEVVESNLRALRAGREFSK
ncbi:MAG: indolepyruvate oxidoreductase subunit beta [Candidatus Delongbacteria bacterium]|nr:indolepyruvate oxidoreductase subunit beta [Candidatus Delongbacteria bacterium]MBN2836173.1 indolepyruvate oxidoreductase subunit beta [Candidatus Delongbacteria bacterium]